MKKFWKKKVNYRIVLIFGMDKARKCSFAFAIDFSKDVILDHVVIIPSMESVVDIEKYESVEYDSKFDDFISKIHKITEV